MIKLNARMILEQKIPKDKIERYPKFLTNIIIGYLENLLHIPEINAIFERTEGKIGINFIDEVFEMLNFDYLIPSIHKAKIPSEGKLIIVSNHPLGGLDGLALLKLIKEVRNDVRIVANDLLMNLPHLSDQFLPFDLYNSNTQKNNIYGIINALNNDEAVIFFPSGVVSRLSIKGIKDRKWQTGAIKLAEKLGVPILPIHIRAKNSLKFYLLSLLNDKIGTILLPSELFKKRNSHLLFSVGDVITSLETEGSGNNLEEKVRNLYDYVYSLKTGNKITPFGSQKAVIPNINPLYLKKEIDQSELLGQTKDNKQILLVDASKSPSLLQEIGRLREITFRKVGQGTGNSYDIGWHDYHYHHIVLWDSGNFEIVGAYRLGLSSMIISKFGKEGLFNSKKFTLSDEFNPILENSIEVGRSFVQSKYWGSNALDYMWQGIGAFLNKFPDIRYLWGTVSMSKEISHQSRNMIVYYYDKWYSGDSNLVIPIKKFVIDSESREYLQKLFNGNSHIKDFKILKNNIFALGESIPTLYRKYAEMCEYGGVKFINFGIDPYFQDAIDGFIVVDLTMMREEIRNRYYVEHSSFEKKDIIN